MERCTTGFKFAWLPVRTGPLGDGPRCWLRWVWWAKAMGVTIYQKPEEFPRLLEQFTQFREERR